MAKLTEKQNKVKIVGILSEMTVRNADKAGKKYIAIDAVIKTGEDSSVAVNSFSFELKNDGNPNKIYTILQGIANTYQPISVVGIDAATRVTLTSASLESGIFFTPGEGRLVDGFKVRNTFYNETRNQQDPFEATFAIDVCVIDIIKEEDIDGKLTGSLIVKGATVKYNSTIDILDFVMEAEDGKKFLEQYYKAGNTVTLYGNIDSQIITETIETAVGFGQPHIETKTKSKKRLVITSGTVPKTGEDAWNKDDMALAIEARDVVLNELATKAKAKSPSGGSSSAAGTTVAPAKGFKF